MAAEFVAGFVAVVSIIGQLQTIYMIIDCIVSYQQGNRKYKDQYQDFVTFLENVETALKSKQSDQHWDRHPQARVNIRVKKYLDQLEELLRTASKLLSELESPLKIANYNGNGLNKIEQIRRDVNEAVLLLTVTLVWQPEQHPHHQHASPSPSPSPSPSTAPHHQQQQTPHVRFQKQSNAQYQQFQQFPQPVASISTAAPVQQILFCNSSSTVGHQQFPSSSYYPQHHAVMDWKAYRNQFSSESSMDFPKIHRNPYGYHPQPQPPPERLSKYPSDCEGFNDWKDYKYRTDVKR